MMAKDFTQAIVVNSVAEEYAIVRQERCDCGGPFKVHMQSLHENLGKMYDVLHCICNACGLEKEFIFDINSFFGKYLSD